MTNLLTNKLTNLPIDFSVLPQKFLLMLAFILIASFLIDYLLSRSFFGRFYRIFVAPGIIIHEFSHALMCLVTGAKISKIALFDKEGGSVTHTPPKIPIIGQIVISLAPIVFGSLVIFLLSRRLGVKEVDITTIALTKEGITHFFSSTFASLNLHSTLTWVIVYLVLSVAVTLTPSAQDLRNIALSVLFIIVVFLLLFKFAGLRLSHAIVVPDQIIILMSTVSFLLILGLFLSIILYVISKIFKQV